MRNKAWIGPLITIVATLLGVAFCGLTVFAANIQGNRLLFQDNDQGPPKYNKRLTRMDDAIDGGKVELVFSLKGKEAMFTEYGNENTGNNLVSDMILNVAQSNDRLTFFGFDSHNGQTELITLYPKLGKALWTTHNDRIFNINNLAISPSTGQSLAAKSNFLSQP